MKDILVSLDPSFTRTGICIINLKDKKIYFDTASCKIGEKQFENIVNAAKSITSQINDVIKDVCDNNYSMIMEAPLPLSSMSAALHSLDTLIYYKFEDTILKTYNPATLRSKIHHRKYDKSDSTNLADRYLKILLDSGYNIISVLGTKKKIPHDCAEAFLYAHLFLHDAGHDDFKFDNSDEVAKYKERVKELKKKEKELMKSDNIGIII